MTKDKKTYKAAAALLTRWFRVLSERRRRRNLLSISSLISFSMKDCAEVLEVRGSSRSSSCQTTRFASESSLLSLYHDGEYAFKSWLCWVWNVNAWPLDFDGPTMEFLLIQSVTSLLRRSALGGQSPILERSWMDIMYMWSNKVYVATVITLLVATATLCKFNLKSGTSEKTHTRPCAFRIYLLQLMDLTQGRVNIPPYLWFEAILWAMHRRAGNQIRGMWLLWCS